jgi:glycosyltransferase involved in cell wall biosynthesis
MKIAVFMPAFNEANVIERVIKDFKRALKPFRRADLIVIDDGSIDDTAKIARRARLRVISHLVNLGLGGAISTGFKMARQEGYDAMVTVDSDGQHHPHDLVAIIKELKKGKADFIVGSRWLKDQSKNVPLHRQLGNKYVMNVLTFLFTGMITSDSQSGLRAFSRRAIELINLVPQRMEVSTELFARAKLHRLRYKEIPIQAIYTDYSMHKGQRSVNGLLIAWRLTISRLI